MTDPHKLEADPSPRRRRPVAVWLGAAAVVVALVTASVFLLVRSADEPEATSPTAQPAVDPTQPSATPANPAAPPAPNVVAFLSVGLGDEEITPLAQEVGTWDGVVGVVVFSSTDALDEARSLFADEPQILDIIEADPSVLPASLRLAVAEEAVEATITRLQGTPGVGQVTTGAFDDLSERFGAPAGVPEPPVIRVGLDVLPEGGAPGDPVEICGRYTGAAAVSLDIWHPETGCRWHEPIDATIEPDDGGAWCWSGVVPADLIALGPQGEEITVPVQPGTYEIRAGSYPEDYAEQATFDVLGVDGLSVTIDQGWSYVTREGEIIISGSVQGEADVRVLSSWQPATAGRSVEQADGRYSIPVRLVPGLNEIEARAPSSSARLAPAVAQITVRYLPDADRVLATVSAVRPEAGEIDVTFIEDGTAAALAIEPNPPVHVLDAGGRMGQVTYERWLSEIDLDIPYWLTIDEGTVVQIEQ